MGAGHAVRKKTEWPKKYYPLSCIICPFRIPTTTTKCFLKHNFKTPSIISISWQLNMNILHLNISNIVGRFVTFKLGWQHGDMFKLPLLNMPTMPIPVTCRTIRKEWGQVIVINTCCFCFLRKVSYYMTNYRKPYNTSPKTDEKSFP